MNYIVSMQICPEEPCYLSSDITATLFSVGDRKLASNGAFDSKEHRDMVSGSEQEKMLASH